MATDTLFYALAVAISLNSALGMYPTFNSTCPVLPNVCPNMNISFYVYTKEFPFTPVIIQGLGQEIGIAKLKLDTRLPIKFLLHGIGGNAADELPNKLLRPAYFSSTKPVNIISLNYQDLATESCIIQATENVDLVAHCSAQFVDNLIKIRNIRLEQFHFIGFSLGTHIAGQIQKYLRSGRIPRITALDPTIFGRPDQHIKRGAAKCIDVLHTNGGDIGVLYPGCGDVEFYINGGITQPGLCGTDELCYHKSSVAYYAETINPTNELYGRRCEFYDFYNGYCENKTTSHYLCNICGEYTNFLLPGLYFVDTNSEPPFGLGRPQYCIPKLPTPPFG